MYICTYTLLSSLDHQQLSTRVMQCLALHPTDIPEMTAGFVCLFELICQWWNMFVVRAFMSTVEGDGKTT